MTLIFAMQLLDIDVQNGRVLAICIFLCKNAKKNAKVIVYGFVKNGVSA